MITARTTGLAGFSPLKQTSGSDQYNTDKDNAKGDSEPWYKKGLDWGQNALDLVGFVPGIGVVADLANAGISIARGDYTRAALSGLAAIPGLDYAAAAGKGLTKLNRAKKLLSPVTSPTNPMRHLRNNPISGGLEVAMGADYANSNLNPLAEQMGLDKDRTSVTEKAVRKVLPPAMKAYNTIKNYSITDDIKETFNMGDKDKANFDTTGMSEKEIQEGIEMDKAMSSDKHDSDVDLYKNKGGVGNLGGGSTKPKSDDDFAKRLRKRQEAMGYFRDK